MTKSKGLFVILALVLPGTAFAHNTQLAGSPGLQVNISVYDYAHVPSETLAIAEHSARRMFQQAGVETVWVTCFPKPEKAESNGCSLVDTTHLTMMILPHALTAHLRNRPDALGDALLDERHVGYYAHVFYDRVQRVAEEHGLGYALLGNVLAHEIGHLLLGSNLHSVSGIMSAHWHERELQIISQGSMCFLPSQSRLMKERLSSRPFDSPGVSPATAVSSDIPVIEIPSFK